MKIGYPPPTLSEITQEPLGQDADLSITASTSQFAGRSQTLNWRWFGNIRGILGEGSDEIRPNNPITKTYDCQNACPPGETISFRATITYRWQAGDIESDEASQSTVIGQEGGGIVVIQNLQTQDPCYIPKTPTRIFTELVTDEDSPVNGAVKADFFKEELNAEGELVRSVPGANSVIFLYHHELNTQDGLDRNDYIWRFTTDDQGEAFLYMDEYLNFDPDETNTYFFVYCYKFTDPGKLGACLNLPGPDGTRISQIDFQDIESITTLDPQTGDSTRNPMCEDPDSCGGVLDDLRPSYAQWTWEPPRKTYNSGICIMLSILFSLLLGAMFLQGKNPFHAFDFSTPRFNRGRQYQMRMQSKMSQAAAIASAVVQQSGLGGAVKGFVGKKLGGLFGNFGGKETGKAKKGLAEQGQPKGQGTGQTAGAKAGEGTKSQVSSPESRVSGTQSPEGPGRVNLIERVPILAPVNLLYQGGKAVFGKKPESKVQGAIPRDIDSMKGIPDLSRIPSTFEGQNLTDSKGKLIPAGSVISPDGRTARTPDGKSVGLSPESQASLRTIQSAGAMNAWMMGTGSSEGQKAVLSLFAAMFTSDSTKRKDLLKSAFANPNASKTGREGLKFIGGRMADIALNQVVDRLAFELGSKLAGASSGVGFGIAYGMSSLAMAPVDREMFKLIRDIYKVRQLKELEQKLAEIQEKVSQVQEQKQAEALISGGKGATVANTIDIQFTRLERIITPEIEWLSKRLGLSEQDISDLSRETDLNAVIDKLMERELDRISAARLAVAVMAMGLVNANTSYTDENGRTVKMTPSQITSLIFEQQGPAFLKLRKFEGFVGNLLGVSSSLLNLEADYALLTTGQFRTASTQNLQDILNRLHEKTSLQTQEILTSTNSPNLIPEAEIRLLLGLKPDAEITQTEIQKLFRLYEEETQQQRFRETLFYYQSQEKLKREFQDFLKTQDKSKQKELQSLYSEFEKSINSFNSARSTDYLATEISNRASSKGAIDAIQYDYRMGLEATLNIKKSMFDALLLKSGLQLSQTEQQDVLRRQQELEAKAKELQVDDRTAITYISQALSLIESTGRLVSENKEEIAKIIHRDLSVNPSMFESQGFATLVENYQTEGHAITLAALLQSNAVSLTTQIGSQEALQASQALNSYLGFLGAQKERAQEIQASQSPGFLREMQRKLQAQDKGEAYMPTGAVSMFTPETSELATALSMYYDGKLKGETKIKQEETVPGTPAIPGTAGTPGTPAVPSTYDFSSLYQVLKSMPQIPTTEAGLKTLQTTLERYSTGQATSQELEKAIKENELFGATRKALVKLDLWENLDLTKAQDQYFFAQSAVIIGRFGEPVGTQALSLISQEKDGHLTLEESKLQQARLDLQKPMKFTDFSGKTFTQDFVSTKEVRNDLSKLSKPTPEIPAVPGTPGTPEIPGTQPQIKTTEIPLSIDLFPLISLYSTQLTAQQTIWDIQERLEPFQRKIERQFERLEASKVGAGAEIQETEKRNLSTAEAASAQAYLLIALCAFC